MVGLARWPYAEVNALAATQRCVVTHEQLRSLGISRAAIGRAIRRRVLDVLWRGVYATVPRQALDPLARELGAVLALGPEAWLSRRSPARDLYQRPRERVVPGIGIGQTPDPYELVRPLPHRVELERRDERRETCAERPVDIARDATHVVGEPR